jgi:ubiquinone/menaquinone biosynthesis C-methylase UbiE
MEINKSMTDNEAIKNPIHIKPEHLLEKDFDQYDYYLSEKVDGVTKKINPQNCKMVPKFPKKYVDELNTEYIADLNIHFVYGIDNYEIDDQEFINDLRDILKLDDIISNFGNLEKYADKERGFMERYMTYIKDNNFSRKTVFWYPKKIWKIYGREVFSTLKNIWDKKCELFPTDGWILWRSDKYSDYLESFDNPMYKIKSQDKLTLDLRYTKDNIMEDFEKNKYRVFIEDDIKIKESIFPGEIYRCYYDSEKDVWCPRDLRKDKKNPNSKEIATYLTDSHTKYSWNIDDILNIKDVDYYCKGGFENSKLSQDYLDIFEKIKGGKVLDIGCGYTPLKREFKEKYRNGNWNKISYTGIDSDFNVFNSHSGNNINILWMDLNLNGANRWGHLYNYFVNQREINSVFSEKYDHILIINSVHYFDMDKLFKTINEVSKPGTRVYLKYLCKEIFDDKLGDFKGYIDNDDNFVRNLGDGRISIYYHWTHNKPQTEKLISGRELEDNFEKIGFKKMESRGIPIKPNNYGNVWCGYLECFILEEFVCL